MGRGLVKAEEPVVISGWSRMQRRVRRFVPGPVRRADLAVFRAVARTHIPFMEAVLPRLSTAANHSRLWMAIALWLGAVGGRFGRRAAVRGMASIGLTSFLINQPGKLLTGRARPDVTPVPTVRQLARVPTSTSFPSGHSASAFAFAAAVGLEVPAMRPVLYPMAAAVATSRVYTGVHYPGDALVGSVMGVVIARATTRTWPLVDRDPVKASETPPADVGADGEGLVIVANSAAGNILRRAAADRIRHELPAARIVQADPGEDLLSTLRRACAEATVLGVAGGDGSTGAAAAVAHEAGKPLAIIPSGTSNHVAKALGTDEVEATVEAVRARRAVAVDIAEVAGRCFVNGARIGAFADLVVERQRLAARVGRWPGTVWALVRILRQHDSIELDIDGRRRAVWMAFVGNCASDPRGVATSRRERLDDGVLDVRILRADVSWARTRVLGALLTGRLERCAAIDRWLAPTLEVSSPSGPLTLATDGEAWEGPAAFTVRKLDRPLLVLQPPASS